MVSYIWVIIDLVNDLLPDGTKPLPGPMLTTHLWDYVAFNREQFLKSSQTTILYNEFENYTFEITTRGRWVNISIVPHVVYLRVEIDCTLKLFQFFWNFCSEEDLHFGPIMKVSSITP